MGAILGQSVAKRHFVRPVSAPPLYFWISWELVQVRICQDGEGRSPHRASDMLFRKPIGEVMEGLTICTCSPQRLYPLRNLKPIITCYCRQFHDNSSSGCWDISVWTKLVGQHSDWWQTLQPWSLAAIVTKMVAVGLFLPEVVRKTWRNTYQLATQTTMHVSTHSCSTNKNVKLFTLFYCL